MAAVLDIMNPIEVRKAGLRALNRALGYEGTQAFMNQHFKGIGDWTQERHELPNLNFDNLTADLEQIDARMRAAGRYNN
jgi:hypothetical protein